MSGRLIINGLNMHLALLGILSIKQQSGVANGIVRYFDLLEDLGGNFVRQNNRYKK